MSDIEIANQWIRQNITGIAYVKSRGGTTFGIPLSQPKKTQPQRLRARLLSKRKRIVAELIDRDGGSCHWCGIALTAGDTTIEHLEPLRNGGSNDLDNLKLVHRSCNR